jgi:hypothetical protein
VQLPTEKTDASQKVVGLELRSLTEEEHKQVDLRLETALEQSPKFRDRWEGSTEDLADTSRSAMDFSMAAMLKARGFTFAETAYLLNERFEHGKGTESSERDLRRCWERSESTAAAGSSRAWINELYTTEEAAQEMGLDPVEMAGLDAYNILAWGINPTSEQDHKELEAEIVGRAHPRALERMNDSIAKTMIGGKVAVIREYTDPAFRTPTYAVMAPAQLIQWFRGRPAYSV